MKAYELDAFDLKILEHLQINNRTSLQDIGQAVNLSAAAVQRRVRRMEDAKVILSNAAVVDPRAVGRPITLIVEVQLDSEQADILDAARIEFASVPEVQQCYYVTGDADFILIITVSSMEEYATLSHRLFLANPNVKHFSTNVAMNRVKVSLNVPVGRASALR
ncbi:MAG: Lrp/AsnC family transcriptional regulator [Afipia sp.]|nr:Lrp/AsnC family transcriptional regulator [Afipia sp.]OJW64448.1 MAG: AsnC family transcriptional regulator [Afipia sp. 64-13]